MILHATRAAVLGDILNRIQALDRAYARFTRHVNDCATGRADPTYRYSRPDLAEWIAIKMAILLVLARILAILEGDRDLYRSLGQALTFTIGRFRDLERYRVANDRAHYRQFSAVQILELIPSEELLISESRALANELNRGLSYDVALGRILDHAASGDRPVHAGSGRSMPGPLTRGVVALAVRLLPAAYQPRYRDEFDVELIELPRRRRCGYAVRVLASAWELRKALVEVLTTLDDEQARQGKR